MQPRTAAWWRMVAPVYRRPIQQPEPIVFGGHFSGFIAKQQMRTQQALFRREQKRIRILTGASARISLPDDPDFRRAVETTQHVTIGAELQPVELILTFPQAHWLALDVRETAEKRLEFGCVVPGSLSF